MGALIRILFPLIGYFCVATVITASAGYVYLRSNGSIDDERMFQIISLVHGIDLDEITEENAADAQDVPPEELSFADHQQQLQMNILHLQAKRNDIEKLITDFKAESTTLSNQRRHIANFRDEVEAFLRQKRDQASADGLAAVRDQWKSLNPKKQTKQMLKEMIKSGQMNIVIEILNGLPPSTVKEILKTLDTEEDLDILFQIEQRMLTGGPEAAFIDQKLNELNQNSN